MKRLLGAFLFLAFLSSSLPAQKTRFGQGLPHARPGVDYPIQLHVSGVRVRVECYGPENCGRMLRAEAVLNGKKVELSGESWLSRSYYQVPVLPGDYQARLLKDPHPVAGTPFYREYEILLPDKTVWSCAVTGLLE
jgi:hypothetical protein